MTTGNPQGTDFAIDRERGNALAKFAQLQSRTTLTTKER
jgi:hypothetical protein